MLRLHTSNRLEALAGQLVEVVREPLSSPLQPEVIVVQSQGMARWLKLQLASHHGICSNCQFPFPRAFSYAACLGTIPGLPAEPAYDAGALVWQVMKQLLECIDRPGFEMARNYLQQDLDGRKRFQLAQQLAQVLDQYLVFRPEMVLEWERQDPAEWQGRLWREISPPFRKEHPAALQARLIESLAEGSLSLAKLPERVAVFGISALPPYYLEIFAALGKRIPVHFFVLEPCAEFWGYIRSDSEQRKVLKQAGRSAAQAELWHLETGNRLLASLGKLGRDFLLLILESGPWHEGELSLFTDPGEATLLSAIQSDILWLRDRGRDGTPRLALAHADDSVQVHSCHSPLRELEVLQDHLLSWFQQDSELAPRDILVMIPEIEEYAPLVHAVFESPEKEEQRIPFSVADRGARSQSHLMETFLALISLADSRLGASAVLALLESEPLRAKFGLVEGDLESIRHWIEEVRIRWGLNQDQRAGLGLPAWDENTWHAGLQRLLAGYAMAGKGEQLFQGILPFDDIEGSAAELLGNFLEFTHQLFEMTQGLSKARSLDSWVGTFQSILERFFATDDVHAPELKVLQDCLENLRASARRAGFNEEISRVVVLEQLTRDLSQDHWHAGYMTGGVTFCALKPMRSIPAKIICLLGMNNSAFPRAAASLSFDLLSTGRRLGDRSSREDDRYLFLETLISARQRLYISYVGQSIRDNCVAPPSVVVSELLDYITQGFESPDQCPIHEHISTRHRLQAFSPAYFSGGRLFSYSRDNLRASQANGPAHMPPTSFITSPIPSPEPEWRRLTFPALAEFLCAPAKYLAQKRLRIKLPARRSSLLEREPFNLDHLERYGLETELLELRRRGMDLAKTLDILRCSGRLPACKPGEACYAQLCRSVESFYATLKPHLPEQFEPAESFELNIDSFRLSGHVSRITRAGLLFYRLATIKPSDLIRAWVEHLFWNAAQRDPKQATSVLVGKDALWTLRPVADARSVLRELLTLYWSGLCQPLKFFPKTSFAFADADFKALAKPPGKSTRTPRECALAIWEGDDYLAQSESQDEYIALFFRESVPLDECFETTARTVFHPLLRNANTAKT